MVFALMDTHWERIEEPAMDAPRISQDSPPSILKKRTYSFGHALTREQS